MRYAIVENSSDLLEGLINFGQGYSMRKDFTSGKSFCRILVEKLEEIQSKEESQNNPLGLVALNLVMSQISMKDFKVFTSVGHREGKGGYRIISLTDPVENNLMLAWSQLYGMAILSDKEKKDNLDEISGNHYLIFEDLPPYIIGVNISGNKVSIINEIEDSETNKKKAELLADFASLIFPKWEKFQSENGITKEFEFAFLTSKNPIQC